MLVGSERNYLSADKLVSDLDGRKYLVYVADLVLQETISSFRRGIAERRPIEAAESHSLDAAKTMTKCMIKDKMVDFIATMKAFENEEKIINKNPDAPTDKLRHDSLRYLAKYFGEVTVQGNHRRYAGLNHWDFQHALIAKALGAGAFHTFDRGFVALEKIPQFAISNLSCIRTNLRDDVSGSRDGRTENMGRSRWRTKDGWPDAAPPYDERPDTSAAALAGGRELPEKTGACRRLVRRAKAVPLVFLATRAA